MSDMRYCGGMVVGQDSFGPVASDWNCYRIFLFQMARCFGTVPAICMV